MTYIRLSDMQVEKRNSNTSHGLRKPLKKGTAEYNKQREDYLELMQGAKKRGRFQRVLEILVEYSPVELSTNEIMGMVRSMGHGSWTEVSMFVKDDECTEFYTRMIKIVKMWEAERKDNEGFIDGTGFGNIDEFVHDGKETLEKIFDAKWFIKRARPLEEMEKDMGVDCSCLCLYTHPGHPAYPAGHGGKFYQTVQTLMRLYDLSDEQTRYLMAIAYIYAMGRTGGGVHHIEDNIASGYIVFGQYKGRFSKYGA